MKKFLSTIGIPIVEHCNLNCKGCLHFCHKGQTPYYYGLENYIKDLKQLHVHFDNVGIFRIYGGEPLLHPKLHFFIEATHREFPNSQINLLTNGILLPLINEQLIRTLKENKVKICWTIYPVMNRRKIKLVYGILNKHGLNYEAKEVDEFYACFNSRGNTEKEFAFQRCSGKYCHVLRNGKISNCPAPLVGQYINSFGANIDFSDGMLDIYDAIDTDEILHFLESSHNACRYCTVPRLFKWEQQGDNVTLEDWKA